MTDWILRKNLDILSDIWLFEPGKFWDFKNDFFGLQKFQKFRWLLGIFSDVLFGLKKFLKIFSYHLYDVFHNFYILMLTNSSIFYM